MISAEKLKNTSTALLLKFILAMHFKLSKMPMNSFLKNKNNGYFMLLSKVTTFPSMFTYLSY